MRGTPAAGQFRFAHPAGQLEQPERVPAGLSHDPVANLLVQLAGHGGYEQRPRVFRDKPLERQGRQGGEQPPVVRLPNGEQEQDCFSEQAPAYEFQDLTRRFVEPLGIIDKAGQRAFRGHLGQQAQRGETHHEPVRRVPGRQPERDPQRLLLRLR